MEQRAIANDMPLHGRPLLRALLIDLNGTLHVGSETTSRAPEAIKRLQEAKIPHLFCSNNTKESTGDVVRKMSRMGFNMHERQVLTSLGACRQLVEQRSLKPLLLLSPSAKGEFPTHIAEAKEGEHDSVILGLHEPSLSYENLNKAFRVLKGEPLGLTAASDDHPTGHGVGTSRRAGRPALIAPHTASFMQTPGTPTLPAGLSLGIGPFVRALEVAADVRAEIVGKPTRAFFEMAIGRLRELYPERMRGVENGDVGIVGDDVENDLGEGALELGMKRILVRTGKFREGDEEKGPPPDGIYDSFADFLDSH